MTTLDFIAWVVFAFCLVVTLDGLCGLFGRRRGEHDAARDISMGQLRWKSIFDPSMDSGNYAALLKARFGLELVCVNDCFLSRYRAAYLVSYNEAMERELVRRFGDSPFLPIMPR